MGKKTIELGNLAIKYFFQTSRKEILAIGKQKMFYHLCSPTSNSKYPVRTTHKIYFSHRSMQIILFLFLNSYSSCNLFAMNQNCIIRCYVAIINYVFKIGFSSIYKNMSFSTIGIGHLKCFILYLITQDSS